MEHIRSTFSHLLPEIPIILLNVVGLWLSISRRKQHPRASLAAGVYFGLNLVMRLVNEASVILLIDNMQNHEGQQSTDIDKILFAFSSIYLPIFIIMDVALLYAIFAPRNHSDHSNTPVPEGNQNA